MEIIIHRRNSLEELLATDERYGIEVDIRSEGGDLIIHHDPFVVGESFDVWINAYRHGTLILNVKEEGLEGRLINVLRERGISNYFFLDQSFPFLLKWSNKGEHRSAVRISEFESIETALALAGMVDWVWVDCFTHFPIDECGARKLRDSGFKICVVSPELHGHDAGVEIPKLATLLREANIVADAVCTKHPDLWDVEDSSQ